MTKLLRHERKLGFGLGVLAALGQAPLSIPWISLLALAGVFALFVRPGTRAGWLGWTFGVGYFAAALFWIVEPFLVDPVRHGWMAPFALVFTAGGFALFWAAAFWGARWLVPDGPLWRQALAWTVTLTTVELARSYILTGFPWALIGHVWIGWAPMHLAAWIGPIGLTLLTAGLPAFAVASGLRRVWAGLAGAGVLGAVLYGVGLWQSLQPVPDAAGAPVVRLVQPNAEQHLKWHPDHAFRFFDDMLAFTAALPDGGGPRPDLVVWPENAIVQILNRAEAWLEAVEQAAAGVPVVFGIQRREEGKAFNTLVVQDGSGAVSGVYDKYHLVPFGEYLPLASWFDAAGQTLIGQGMGSGYAPGPGPQTLALPGRLGTALPLICYEGIFPQNVRGAPERPDFLLLITNDAWFGDVAGPYQHLAQARLRAVEHGLPMVRVANTGVSAMIDARGRVTAEIPLGEAGWVDALLPKALPPTLYARTGDWPFLVVLCAALGGLVATRRRVALDAPPTPH